MKKQIMLSGVHLFTLTRELEKRPIFSLGTSLLSSFKKDTGIWMVTTIH